MIQLPIKSYLELHPPTVQKLAWQIKDDDIIVAPNRIGMVLVVVPVEGGFVFHSVHNSWFFGTYDSVTVKA